MMATFTITETLAITETTGIDNIQATTKSTARLTQTGVALTTIAPVRSDRIVPALVPQDEEDHVESRSHSKTKLAFIMAVLWVGLLIQERKNNE